MKKIISIILLGIFVVSGVGANNFDGNRICIKKVVISTNSGMPTVHAHLPLSVEVSWTTHSIDNDFGHASGVHACDIDGDGNIDVVASSFSRNEIAWWHNDGGNPFQWTKHVIDNSFGGAIDVFACDVDGDSIIDVLGAAWSAGEIAWWHNDGGDPIQWKKQLIATNYQNAHDVYAYDMDLDGILDVLGASAGLNEITWWHNDGGGPIQWSVHTIGNTFGGARSVFSTDIDGDGDYDALGAAFDTNEIAWWRNEGGDPPRWTKFIIADDFAGSHYAYAYDVDSDGDVDVLGAGYFSDEIAWWRNEGGDPVTWTKHIIDNQVNGAMRVIVADIDDDGNNDVVGSSSLSNYIAWWHNENSNITLWSQQVIDNSCARAWPIFTVDMDNDGDIDVVGGSELNSGIRWYENHRYPKPEKPSINGPTTGKIGEEYYYTSSTTDPAGTQLYYLFDWGDGNISQWIGPSNSGEAINASHVWNEKGSYQIRVKAMNSYASESDWSDPLPVTMPKTYDNPFHEIIERLFGWFFSTILKINI